VAGLVVAAQPDADQRQVPGQPHMAAKSGCLSSGIPATAGPRGYYRHCMQPVVFGYGLLMWASPSSRSMCRMRAKELT
jgi:hypothetical protein